MSASPPILSARIRALERQLIAHPTALDAFWEEIGAEGAPIVERIAGEPGQRLLTFLWRGDADTRNVVVVGGPARWQPVSADVMAQLPGTDVWHKSYRVRSDLRGRYWFSVNDSLEEPDDGTDWNDRESTFRLDPLNPHRVAWPKNEDDPASREEPFSVIELTDAPPQPWREPRDDMEPGTVTEHRISSAILSNERRVWVYQPAASLTTVEPVSLAILFDGWVWARALSIAPSLDNLHAERAVPPTVVVMPDAVDDGTRSLELGCYEPFVTFLADELLPWMHERWNITTDPTRTIVAGQSLGGLAAAFVGRTRPDLFGNVLSQSGSFWWKDQGEFDEGAEELTHRYASEPKVPLRIWSEVGLLEGPRMLVPNRHLRDVWVAKGYDVSYREYFGGHDWYCWRGGLADGLIALSDHS